jgi:hypothetical protein
MQLPNPDVEEIEQAISSLDQGDSANLSIWSDQRVLRAFCSEAAMLQFIVTWSRRHGSKATAQFTDFENNATGFDVTLKTALGIPHVVSAWVLASKLLDSHGIPLKRIEAKGYVSYLDAMDKFDFPRTHDTSESRANLVCVQGGQREYIRPLYEYIKGEWVVLPEGELRAMVQDIISLLAPDWKVKYLREVCDPLAHLVHELVQNSDWWARLDQNGKLYSKGIRAVTFRLIDVDDDNLMKFAGANHHLKSYLIHSLVNDERARIQAPSSRSDRIRTLSYIELSITDSGPGLARRWLASREKNKRSVDDLLTITLEEEEEALIECFRKWKTTSGNSLRGIGLFSVARLLIRKNGFMRLRTGRLAFLFGTRSAIADVETRLRKEAGKEIASDYIKLGDGTHVFLDNGQMIFFLRHWSDAPLAAVEGTAYSILLPV